MATTTEPLTVDPATHPSPQSGTRMRMLAQYVKEFSFNSPHAPRSLRVSTESPNLQLDVAIGQTRIDRNVYEVSVRMIGGASNTSGALYDFKLVYAGLFELSGFSDSHLQATLFTHCPALTFPFLRQLIGDAVRHGGFAPVWLDPIDWGGLYLQRLEAEMAAKPN